MDIVQRYVGLGRGLKEGSILTTRLGGLCYISSNNKF